MIAIFAVLAMHWLVMSDVHMNPFDGLPEAPYAEDTNPWLFDKSVAEMRKAVPDAAVVVIPGDFLAHHFPARAQDARRDPYTAGRETIAAIVRKLDRAFPRAQFLIALGNNDDPCGDYYSEAGGTYERDLATLFEPLVNRHGAAPSFARDFARGGYYTATLPGGARGVVLNSVMWSFVYRGSCQIHVRNPGATEMQWLARQLGDGTNVVVMHMPPGYDAQSTTTAHRVVAVPFLAAGYDAQLRSLFARDRTHVAFALAGHTHRYDFRIPGGIPMLVVSSLSPIYRNSPAFYRLDVNGSELRDVVPYTYDVDSATWTVRPSFDATYGTKSFSDGDLGALSERIATQPELRTKWIEAYDVWSWRMGDISDHSWQTFRCAEVAFGDAYRHCAGTTKRSIAAIVTLAAAVLAIVATIAIVVRRRSTLRRS